MSTFFDHNNLHLGGVNAKFKLFHALFYVTKCDTCIAFHSFDKAKRKEYKKSNRRKNAKSKLKAGHTSH